MSQAENSHTPSTLKKPYSLPSKTVTAYLLLQPMRIISASHAT